jgi:capsular exopolysaccharide synthesis family protein
MNASAPPNLPLEGPPDVRTYLEVIWRRRWLVLGVVVVATLGTYMISKAATKQYASTAQVQLQPQSSGPLLGGQTGTETLAQDLAATQLLLRTPRLAVQAASRLRPPPRDRQSLLSQITVTTDQDAGFVIIRGQDPNPRRAAAIANAVAAALIDVRANRARAQIDQAVAQLQQQLATIPSTDVRDRQGVSGQIRQLQARRAAQGFLDQVVQPALVPGEPVSPRPLRNSILAFVLSLLIAVGLVFLLERLDRRLRDADDLTSLTGVPLLGEIPSAAFSSEQARPVVEAFQMLRANLAYFDIDRPLDSVLVTSPLPGDGKTTVAVNLARAAAQAGKDVFLVDTDLRDPQVGARTGGGNDRGLGSVLAGEKELEDVVTESRVGDGRLRVLPGGAPPPNPSALVTSEAMRELVARLAEESDLVVFDTPPMLVVGDAVPLLEQTSGVILVARLGWTTRDAIGRARDLIYHTRGVLLGAVTTGAKPPALYRYEPIAGRPAPAILPNGQVPASARASTRARRWLRALTARR